MTSNEKLSFLMEIFKSNNSKLAKAINVHPSLISKWRTGKRTFSTESIYVESIAEYFLGIDIFQNKKEMLIEILKQFNSNINMCNRTQLKRYLIEWIFAGNTDDLKSEIGQYGKNNYRNYGVNDLLINLNNLTYDLPDTGISNILPDIEVPVTKGEPGYYEVFKGKEGKRQSALNIIDMILASDKPLELLLCDETNLDWLLDDPKFFTEFSGILKQLIARGHKIIIIHNINRELSQLMAIMDFWLPLYLTGCVESYFSSRNTNGKITKTLCIVRNTAAVLSVKSESDMENSNIFISKDQLFVKLAEDVFMSYLDKCRSLVKIYKGVNIEKYYDEVNDIEDRIGYVYTLRNRLSSLALPEETYSKLLDTLPLLPQGKKERLDFHNKRIKNFKERINYCKYIEIVNIDYFEGSFKNLIKFDGLDFFVTEAVKCEIDDFIAYITNLIHLLTEYKNYEVLLVKFNNIITSNRVSMTVKTDCTAFISTCGFDESNPVIIATELDHMVEGIKYYLLNLIDNIPIARVSKEAVIGRLEETNRVLKEWRKYDNADLP